MTTSATADRTAGKRERTKAANRAAILRAGREVFSDIGYGAASVRDIAEDTAAMRSRYVASKRHTIQVDFDDYLFDLARERKRGAQRARAAGFALPVPRRPAVAVGEPVAA